MTGAASRLVLVLLASAGLACSSGIDSACPHPVACVRALDADYAVHCRPHLSPTMLRGNIEVDEIPPTGGLPIDGKEIAGYSPSEVIALRFQDAMCPNAKTQNWIPALRADLFATPEGNAMILDLARETRDSL